MLHYSGSSQDRNVRCVSIVGTLWPDRKGCYIVEASRQWQLRGTWKGLLDFNQFIQCICGKAPADRYEIPQRERL